MQKKYSRLQLNVEKNKILVVGETRERTTKIKKEKN